MKRILFVAPFDGISGGVLRWAENIFNYYQSHKNPNLEIDKFSTGRSHFVNINQTFLLRLYYALLDYVGIIRKFSKVLKNTRYDVVHIASSASISLVKDLILIQIAHKYDAKAIVHFHFGRIPQLIEQKNWEYKLLLSVIKRADSIIVIDEYSYDALQTIDVTNVFLIPNPLSPNIIDRINLCKSTVNRVPNKILFVGHVVRTKGVFELITACMHIPNINLYIVGYAEPEMRQQLMKLADNAKWLNIVGEKPQEDVIKEMLSCDIFILPTYTEGFPNVILESMACECAIIASAVGAIPEMLVGTNGEKCGLLISPRNVEDIKKAVLTFMENAQLKNECRTNAKKYVELNYTMSMVWDKMCHIWIEM